MAPAVTRRARHCGPGWAGRSLGRPRPLTSDPGLVAGKTKARIGIGRDLPLCYLAELEGGQLPDDDIWSSRGQPVWLRFLSLAADVLRGVPPPTRKGEGSFRAEAPVWVCLCQSCVLPPPCSTFAHIEGGAKAASRVPPRPPSRTPLWLGAGSAGRLLGAHPPQPCPWPSSG